MRSFQKWYIQINIVTPIKNCITLSVVNVQEVNAVEIEKNTAENKAKLQTQALIYAVEKYPLINRTKMMKFIFFIDLYVFNKTGNTLFEDKYIRLPNGPVPDYGFRLTDPNPNINEFHDSPFNILKIQTKEDPKYYHYQFTLKDGIKSDLSQFDRVQIDLMNLTLQTMMSYKTAYLSELSHSYKLWQNYLNGSQINLIDFELNDEELEKLEIILNTRIYLTPMNYDPQKISETGQISRKMPSQLPVYFNAKTKEEITSLADNS